MNRQMGKLLMAAKGCLVALSLSFFVATALDHIPLKPAASETECAQSRLPVNLRFAPQLAAWDQGRMPPDTISSDLINLINEFRNAWRFSGAGLNGREGVVLIFRMQDGSYQGKLQRFTNEFRKVTFDWDPAARAIVHTHPNLCDPEPTAQDKRIADKYRVPNCTITVSGMYVYDPATKKTSKILDGLDWLKPNRWYQRPALRGGASGNGVDLSISALLLNTSFVERGFLIARAASAIATGNRPPEPFFGDKASQPVFTKTLPQLDRKIMTAKARPGYPAHEMDEDNSGAYRTRLTNGSAI